MKHEFVDLSGPQATTYQQSNIEVVVVLWCGDALLPRDFDTKGNINSTLNQNSTAECQVIGEAQMGQLGHMQVHNRMAEVQDLRV